MESLQRTNAVRALFIFLKQKVADKLSFLQHSQATFRAHLEAGMSFPTLTLGGKEARRDDLPIFGRYYESVAWLGERFDAPPQTRDLGILINPWAIDSAGVTMVNLCRFWQKSCQLAKGAENDRDLEFANGLLACCHVGG
ncbi:hypothetical protein ZHAS_00007001 [Anopheles sinensis]|uniref:Uncharacterized protein n=1 Tax=Anopheles sinensis TaxID=74873 RepID=A0A084VNG0_ANOSI|nr:hypothetical protein ZHAS_00007001 [Anopheles sinensis]